MADLSDDVEVGLTSEVPAVPNFDGNAEPATKSKKKQTKRRPRKCPSCPRKTSSEDGICKECKKDQKQARTSKSITDTTDLQDEGSNTRENSTIATPEPVDRHDPGALKGVTGSSYSLERTPTFTNQSTPSRNPARRSIYSHEDSPDPPHAPAHPFDALLEVKSEESEPRISASLATLIGSDRGFKPVVELPISPSKKRQLADVDGDNSSDNGEGDLDNHEVVRKQRKLNTAPDLPGDTTATEDMAIQAFKDAVAKQQSAQAQQVADLQEAQEEQVEALRSAHLSQFNVLSTANTSFIASFYALQTSRDDYKDEMEDWKEKHASLEVILCKTEVERDDWKSAKAKVDEEKAAVEKAKEQVDEANAQEIARLKKQVEKLRKGKTDLIKQLTAGDSD